MWAASHIPMIFHIKIDGGDEQTIEIVSSYYLSAAAAAVAFVNNDQLDKGVQIEIWIPDLLPDYPGHTYAIIRNEFGNLEIGIAYNDKPLRIKMP